MVVGGVERRETMVEHARHPATVEALDISEAEDGLVVYNDATDTVHHLNRTAAVVFGLCDGTRDADAIAAEVGTLFALDEPPLEEIVTCLDELSQSGLIR